MLKTIAVVILMTVLLEGLAQADPVLPDYTAATFDAQSSVSDNTYFPLVPGALAIFEGQVEEGTERIETLVTPDTKTILGIQNRVVRDSAYLNGALAEVALDWFAQDTDGTVWYFGEFVENYTYDDEGNLVSIDNVGSWEAGVNGALPGVVMFASPQVGDEYFQENAPGVALDFAEVTSLDGSVDTAFGSFDNVLVTGEGNLFDDPELTIVENKLYAPQVGLVLIQELNDEGEVEFEVQRIPEPATLSLLVLGGLALVRRREVPPG